MYQDGMYSEMIIQHRQLLTWYVLQNIAPTFKSYTQTLTSRRR